tara:strand:+ start:407 stop:691 length:285 start_codon:yes stop_codon:yes gene_type:complete
VKNMDLKELVKELVKMRMEELEEYVINYPLETMGLLVAMGWFIMCLNMCYRSAEGDEDMDKFAFFMFFMGMYLLFPVYFVFDIILGMNLSGVDD